MGDQHSSQIDVVAFIKAQHDEIRRLLTEVQTSAIADRAASFQRLRQFLAVHETAEEEVVHPRARRTLNGEAIVTARLAEENAVKMQLAELEALVADDPRFAARFAALNDAVLTHMAQEENEELRWLAVEVDPARLRRMARIVRAAERLAPTRVHPGMESAAANVLIGPFAAMTDRIRDAFRSV